jgi:RNA polymerase sigma-70 factor (ECF subfamily)
MDPKKSAASSDSTDGATQRDEVHDGMSSTAGISAAGLPAGDLTDQELLRAYAASRDRDSLGRFLARYEASLMRFAGRLLGDRDAAQDVVQETFLQVARHPGRLLGVESCHNWLLRVARNIGVSRIRREARTRRHEETLRARAAALGEETAETAGPSGALEREEVRDRVRAAMDRLNPRYREILILKITEEKSYREIAEITGLSVTNVGYLLHQALKALSVRLDHSREMLS